jgi:hypothetical protein
MAKRAAKKKKDEQPKKTPAEMIAELEADYKKLEAALADLNQRASVTATQMVRIEGAIAALKKL